MKRLLTQLGFPKAIGLFIDEHAVHLSQIVATPFGPVEITRCSEEIGPDQLCLALDKLLKPVSSRRGLGRVPVAVGLPAGRIYFSTRPIQMAGGEASPHVLLREALRSANVSVDKMAVDVIKSKPDKRPVAGIAACDRKYLTELLDSLKACGIRPHRAEPAPCALLRAAANRHAAPRNAKVVLRLLLSDTRAEGILAVNNHPVVWRSFSLPRGDEASALISAARTLLTMSRNCGIESSLDVVMLHGRSDLTRLLDMDWLKEEMGVPVEWFDGPSLESGAIAFGLALGCVNEGEKAFDLAQLFKPRATIREVFPWREAILQAALLLAMALFLAHHLGSVKRSYQTARTHNTEHPWLASMQTQQLQKEKSDLTQKVAAVNKFLSKRVSWTSYGRELATCLPENVFLTAFQGDSQLESAGKKRGQAKPKRSLMLHGAAAIGEDGSMPREIDLFLDTLRAHPLLKREFPLVELAALKQSKRVGQKTATALFTVMCLPKTAKKSPK